MSSLPLGFVIIVALAGTAGIVLLPVVPVGVLTLTVVLVRSLTDVGAASTGSLLPSSLMSAVLAALAITLFAHRSKGLLPTPWWAIIGTAILATGVSACTGLLVFGVQGFVVEEMLRVLSIVGVFLGGAHMVRNKTISLDVVLSVVTIPPAGLLIFGALTQLAPLMQSGGRAVGTFSHANSAAAYFGAAILLAVWFRGGSAKLRYCVIAFAAISLVLTQSLGSVAAVMIAVLLPSLVSSRLRVGYKMIIIVGLAFVSTVLLYATGVGARIAELRQYSGVIASAPARTSSDSLVWRLLNWRLLVDEWRERPVFGYGLGSTYTEVTPLGGPPHSLFVQILVESGLVGVVLLLAFSVLLVAGIRKGVRNRHVNGTAGASMLVFIVVLGSESNLLGYSAADYLLALGASFLLLEPGYSARSPDRVDFRKVNHAHSATQ